MVNLRDGIPTDTDSDADAEIVACAAAIANSRACDQLRSMRALDDIDIIMF